MHALCNNMDLMEPHVKRHGVAETIAMRHGWLHSHRPHGEMSGAYSRKTD